MKCTECGASGYGLHHSATCKYLNIDIYAKCDELQKQSDLLTLGLVQEKNKVARLEEKLKKNIASHNAQVEDLYKMAHRAREAGVKEGLCKYAWWKDGIQYVGTCGKTLKEALLDI